MWIGIYLIAQSFFAGFVQPPLSPAKPAAAFPLDGINLLPILTGQQEVVARRLYWRTFQRSKQKAIRAGEWKYLQDAQGEYLFNLTADQGEKQDLKTTQPDLFNQLKLEFAQWDKTVLPPVPL